MESTDSSYQSAIVPIPGAISAPGFPVTDLLPGLFRPRSFYQGLRISPLGRVCRVRHSRECPPADTRSAGRPGLKTFLFSCDVAGLKRFFSS